MFRKKLSVKDRNFNGLCCPFRPQYTLGVEHRQAIERHPRDLSASEVEQFLTHLAVNGKVAASTQNQAKAALLFLYREVLAMELPWLDNIEQGRKAQ